MDEMARLTLAWCVLALAACANALDPANEVTEPDGPPPPPTVRVLASAVAESRAAAEQLHAEVLRMPLADGATVDDAVPALMAAASERGARYASGISVVTRDAQDGSPLSCETQVVPVAELATVVDAEEVPGHVEQHAVHQTTTRPVTAHVRECKSVMRPTTRTRTESVRECHSVRRPHTRTRTEYSHQYDSRTHSYRSVPRTRTETEYRNEQECRFVPRTKSYVEHHLEYQCAYVSKTRYERHGRWVTQSTFVPPRTEWVTRTDWRWRAAVSPAVCAPADHAAQLDGAAVATATIWLPGAAPAQVPDTSPPVAPSPASQPLPVTAPEPSAPTPPTAADERAIDPFAP